MSAGRKSDQTSIDVNIMGREYRVACKPEEQAELLEAVAHVDRQMREIRDTLKINNAERVAVMTALNVTNELLRARSNAGAAASAAAGAGGHASAGTGAGAQPGAAGVDLSALKRRIQSMQSTIDTTLTEQERLL